MELLPLPPEREGDRSGQHRAILQRLYTGVISIQRAAEMLASLSLKDDPETGLLDTWQIVIGIAEHSADRHQILSESLAVMATLPPAKDDQGEQLVIWDHPVWNGLPIFSAELYDEWRYRDNREDVTKFINLNKFAAQLVRTPKSMFAGIDSFGLWALWLMRDALEYPGGAHNWSLETSIPAILAWLSILGPEIHSWDYEFPSGQRRGDPGRGGPLWNGKHGFCKERWTLWKQRFTDISTSNELTKELRELAEEGAPLMRRAENQAALL